MPSYDQLKNYEWDNNSTLRDFVEHLRSLKERDNDYSQDGLVDSLVKMIVEKEDKYARELNVQNIVDWDNIDFDTYVYVYWMIMYEFFGGNDLLKPDEKQRIEIMLKGKCFIKYTE